MSKSLAKRVRKLEVSLSTTPTRQQIAERVTAVLNGLRRGEFDNTPDLKAKAERVREILETAQARKTAVEGQR